MKTITRAGNGTGRVRRSKILDTRPLYATIFIFGFLAFYSLVLRGIIPAPKLATALSRNHHEQRSLHSASAEDCHMVRDAPDKCAFVKQNCQDDEAGLFDYLTFYYCGLGHLQPLAFIILVLWLGLLFTTIGIAASDFFSVNLSTISAFLGLSESLAGVTFLAFGNGSPDVFSTFAAMSSNSGSMALGELVGAAGFITTVVAGSMALVREFKVARKAFVRDICFFIVAIVSAVVFLIDGQLHISECIIMIGFYVFYVIVVVGWHTYTKRLNESKAKEAASRAHFYRTASDRDNDELEPYRDNPDDGEPSASRGRDATPLDIEALERAPMIDIDGPNELHDDGIDRNQLVAAEVTSSMRLHRPRGRRSTTTLTPIRPSLVGALEFRSVLASLQREGTVRMRPINSRTHTTDNTQVGPHLTVQEPTIPYLGFDHDTSSRGTRNRALSSGHMPTAIDSDIAGRQLAINEWERSLRPHTVGGRLAPPLPNDTLYEGSSSENEARSSTPALHRLAIPSPSNSGRSSPESSPFPSFTDSPMPITPTTHQVPYHDIPSPTTDFSSPVPSVTGHTEPRPVMWWPYAFLPPPHVLLSTLFPTLQAWHTKTIWDKFVSVISVPTIFLLVITLPVVEDEGTADSLEDIVAEQPVLDHIHVAPTVVVETEESIQHETEWERYRRSTRSGTSSRSPSPNPVNVDSSHTSMRGITASSSTTPPNIRIQPQEAPADMGRNTSTKVEEDQSWNRWLLVIQLFAGPEFCVLVFWANFAEDLERPGIVLVRALLTSLVFSLVLLGVLLATTSPNRRPKYHVVFCFLGFVIAIAWISTVAGEVVGILKAFGIILDISEAILGLTIFAIGNSIGDLVADITIARLGYPVMALSACFGGPLLNILLGVGLGGAYQLIQAANSYHSEHPDEPYEYKPYHIEVTGTLIVSTSVLLITLFALLVVVPMQGWMMTKKIGWGLIALWTTSTVINLVMEITGSWRDVA